ncbi:MAG: methylmalonyl-CoA epimerase [Caldisericia bacterium]|nr:methylmalonyl-CoA epimerase [Caldisericia bacterium]
MFEAIDHIGIAVKSLNSIKSFYKNVLNIDFLYEEELPENKVKVLVFRFGDTNIEYLEPLTDDSPVKKFLDSKGEGIHHIAFKVKNIDERLKFLKEKGLSLIDEKPRRGSHNKKIAFIHPKSTFGTLIELVEE